MKAAGQGASAAAAADPKGKPPPDRKKDLRDCAIIRFKGSNADKIDSQFFGRQYEKGDDQAAGDDEFNFDVDEYGKHVAEDLCDDVKVQVYSHGAFSQLFTARPGGEPWKSISSIQTCVKAQIGCGTPIVVQFFAPINSKNPEEPIEYDYASIGDDEDLIKLGDAGEKFCLKQVYKMCFYVSKLYQLEILRMKCEFFKDQNGTVWFANAS